MPDEVSNVTDENHDHAAEITKMPAASPEKAAEPERERREFDPTRTERLAISALSLEQQKLNAESQAIVAEIRARLGLDETWTVQLDAQSGKFVAQRMPQ